MNLTRVTPNCILLGLNFQWLFREQLGGRGSRGRGEEGREGLSLRALGPDSHQEFVTRMVELQHSLLRARGQTSSWHLEWPGRLAALLDSTQEKQVLAELKSDQSAFEEASKQEAVFWKRLCSRSILNHARMKQFVFLAKQSAWAPSQPLRRLAEVTFAGITATKMIEDANKIHRTAETSKNFSKRLSDHTT